MFVAGDMLECELCAKVTRALVGVDLVALVLGIFEIAFMEVYGVIFCVVKTESISGTKQRIFRLVIFIVRVLYFRA